MARTDDGAEEEDFVTTKSQDFIDMFGLNDKTNYASWATLYREMYGKPAKGSKVDLMQSVEKFLSENPLSKIVEIHKRMEDKREAAARKKETAKKRSAKSNSDIEDEDEDGQSELTSKKRKKKPREELKIPEQNEQEEVELLSEEEIEMDANIWTSIFPENFFGDSIDAVKRKEILKRWPTYVQSPLDAPSLPNAFSQKMGFGAKAREKEYLSLQRRLLEATQPLQNLVEILAKNLLEKADLWGPAIKDTMRIITVTQHQLSDMRLKNMLRAEGGKEATVLVERKPRGQPLVSEELKQEMKDLKKVKSAIADQRKVNNKTYGQNRFFRRGGYQGPRGNRGSYNGRGRNFGGRFYQSRDRGGRFSSQRVVVQPQNQ